jgi:hypothetical protein
MTWITEAIGVVLIAGALVLLGLGKITFEQAISIITLGVGIIGGKYIAQADRYFDKKYALVRLVRKFNKQLMAVSVAGNVVELYINSKFINYKDIVEKIMKEANKLFPDKKIEVVESEEIRFV